jgi:hypothetical protein
VNVERMKKINPIKNFIRKIIVIYQQKVKNPENSSRITQIKKIAQITLRSVSPYSARNDRIKQMWIVPKYPEINKSFYFFLAICYNKLSLSGFIFV